MSFMEYFLGSFSEFTVFLVAILLVSLSLLMIVWRAEPEATDGVPTKSLPGPWISLPFIGCPWKTGFKLPHQMLTALKDEYGEVYAINLLGRGNVILNTHDAVREGFQKKGDAITGKPFSYLRSDVIKDAGLLMNDGPVWKEQRRFTLNAMRDLGMGKSSMVPPIQDEASHLIDIFNEQHGQPFDPKTTIGVTVSNVICCLVFGAKNQSYYSETSKEILRTITSNASSNIIRNSRLSFLRHLPGDVTGIKQFIANIKYIQNVIGPYIDEHRRTFDPNNVNDFTHAYMRRIQENAGKKTEIFNDHQMRRTVFEMFVAGSETTSTSLRWSLLLMCANPEVQNKVQEEIDSVIGRDRLPSIEDKLKMPYTDAVILEILRVGTLVTLVPHRATETTTLRGYTVKKDALVIANLWALHRDKNVWPNPDQFDVGNFIDNDGQPINRDKIAVFSIGKRQCAGESLAKMELFIFYVSLMQAFTVKLAPGEDADALISDPVVGVVRSPKPFRICATPRPSNCFKLPHQMLTALKDEYGDVYAINLLGRGNVILNTHDAVREGFQKKGDAITGKPFSYLRSDVIKNAGLLATDGPVWKEQRRFTLNAMRDLGMGKSSMVPSIQDEASHLIDIFNEQHGQPFDPKLTIGVTVSNVICCLVFGAKNQSYYSETSKAILRTITSNVSRNVLRMSRLSFLRHLPGDVTGIKQFIANIKYIQNVIGPYIDEHRRTFDPNNVNDFTHAYMRRIQENAGKKTEIFNEHFSDHQMRRTVFEMFVAGSETTSTSLRWSLLLMCANPEVQNKVQEEIDSVIGRDRLPSIEDKLKMPYTDAVILEILRVGTLVTLVPHRATETTTLRGYTVKKDTLVLANLWALHRDKNVWPNPDQFDVSNFIDSDGQPINRDKIAVFSIGKRQCAGESLAKMELFIFYVSLMQAFTVKLAPGEDADALISDPVVGVVRSPKPFRLCATPRPSN
ncbi:cytochrome P450 2E1-like [Tubulanus polymorphus]|uniref:cytochrome P450 2E1-like n=1 Tax=Tubulanus polymorphus TaxID=672921 RepID=UPI003DA4C1C5